MYELYNTSYIKRYPNILRKKIKGVNKMTPITLNKEIKFSPDELKYLTKKEITNLKMLKEYAKNLKEFPGNYFCPICGHRLTEERMPYGDSNYVCSICNYGAL